MLMEVQQQSASIVTLEGILCPAKLFAPPALQASMLDHRPHSVPCVLSTRTTTTMIPGPCARAVLLELTLVARLASHKHQAALRTCVHRLLIQPCCDCSVMKHQKRLLPRAPRISAHWGATVQRTGCQTWLWNHTRYVWKPAHRWCCRVVNVGAHHSKARIRSVSSGTRQPVQLRSLWARWARSVAMQTLTSSQTIWCPLQRPVPDSQPPLRSQAARPVLNARP